MLEGRKSDGPTGRVIGAAVSGSEGWDGGTWELKEECSFA